MEASFGNIHGRLGFFILLVTRGVNPGSAPDMPGHEVCKSTQPVLALEAGMLIGLMDT